MLEAGDRVEIYRPLLIDPKQARLARAKEGKEKAQEKANEIDRGKEKGRKQGKEKSKEKGREGKGREV